MRTEAPLNSNRNRQITRQVTRLVVIDYAEARVAQLVSLLPMLEAGASRLYPVRVVLLVRNRPAGAADWRDGLRLIGGHFHQPGDLPG